MKYILIGLFSIFILSCNNTEVRNINTDIIPSPNDTQKAEDMPKMTFKKTKFDFGKIIEGEDVTYTFEFENTGNSDLVISDVTPECGCTTAKNWSKKPYRPGENGEITITFESEGRPGKTHKNITVISNAFPAVNDLVLEGEVIGPQK